MTTDADAPKPEELPDDQVSLARDQAQAEPEQAGLPWKRIVVGGAIWTVATAAITAVVTLAVTHNSAVRANFQAYMNGRRDAHSENGFYDGYNAGFDDGVGEHEDFTLG